MQENHGRISDFGLKEAKQARLHVSSEMPDFQRWDVLDRGNEHTRARTKAVKHGDGGGHGKQGRQALDFLGSQV
jgi:hypothetical protein